MAPYLSSPGWQGTRRGMYVSCLRKSCWQISSSSNLRGQEGVICSHESIIDSAGLCKDNNTCSCSYLPRLHSHTQQIFKSKNFSLLYSPFLTDTNAKCYNKLISLQLICLSDKWCSRILERLKGGDGIKSGVCRGWQQSSSGSHSLTAEDFRKASVSNCKEAEI